MSSKDHFIGPFGSVLIAMLLWAISGLAAQVLFQLYHFPAVGLVSIRLLIAGGILYAVLRPKFPKKDLKGLSLFGIFGIIPSQAFYLIAIAYANVTIALLLQMLFLPIVVIYEAYKGVHRYSYWQVLAVVAMMVGTFLVATSSPFSIQLQINPIALVAGLLSAFGAAYNTIAPKSLMQRHGPWEVTMWAFIIAGVIMVPFSAYSLYQSANAWLVSPPLQMIGLILVVAIIGTLLAYGLMVRGLKFLTSTEVAVAAVGEPLIAGVLAFLLLDVVLSAYQLLGGAIMIVSMYILRYSLGSPQVDEEEEAKVG